MIVSVCKCKLALTSRTLKDKRKIVQSIKQTVLNRFPVSIAEVCMNDTPGVTVFGVAAVSSSGKIAEELINQTIKHIEHSRPDVEVILIESEILTGF